MLPKKNRLTRKKDFDLVFKKGKSFKEDFLILRAVGSKTEDCRFGIVVSKKISKKATVRNRVKRKLRALTELKIKKIKKGTDIIFIALPGLERKEFSEVEKTINSLFKKSKLIKDV